MEISTTLLLYLAATSLCISHISYLILTLEQEVPGRKGNKERTKALDSSHLGALSLRRELLSHYWERLQPSYTNFISREITMESNVLPENGHEQISPKSMRNCPSLILAAEAGSRSKSP